MKQAAIAGGFAPTTARTPKAKGLNAQECIAEAKKLDPKYDPSNILAEARRVMQQRLETLDPSKEPPHQIARIVEVAEKYYGSHGAAGGDTDPRQFADRMAWVMAVANRLRELEPGAAPLDVAVTNESESNNQGQRQLSPSKDEG